MDQMSQSLGSFLPQSLQWAVGPLIALIIIIIGYFISKIVEALVSKGINSTGIGRKAQTTGGNIGKSLSKAAFWTLWLMFILIGLSRFPMVAEALEPIQTMLDNIFAYLPQLFIGAVVFAIGIMLSKVVKEAMSSTLEAAQIDRLAAKYGFAGADEAKPGNNIARALGGLASAIVLIIFGITAIGIWDIPGVSGPVSDMLQTVLTYIPNIFGFAIIMAITIFIARFVANLARNTLPALGVDNSVKAITSLDGGDASSFVPSRIIATIAFVGITLMGLTAAMGVLNIPELTNVFNTLLEVGGRVVLGAVIIGVGLFIANFVAKIVSEASGELAGRIIKYAAMLIFTFMGLRAMDLGSEIVEAAFNYTVMAAAVAAGVGGALAFGLGGREWAGKKLQQWWPAKGTRSPRSNK